MAVGDSALAQAPAKLWGEGGLPVNMASGSQFAATAVPDGAGGLFVAWQDTRSFQFFPDIYVQRIRADGARLWTPSGVLIAAAPGLNNQPADQTLPVITGDGAGGAIVAWRDYRNTLPPLGFRTQYDVYAQRIDSDGQILWQTHGVPVSTACWTPGAPCSNSKSSLQITSDGSGGAIIAWYEMRDGFNFSVWAQKIRSDGTPAWTIDGVPVASGNFYAAFPKIVSDEAGGAFIAWQDHRNAGVAIFRQHLDASGNALLTPNGIEVAHSTAQAAERGHQLIGDGAGGAILVWVDGRNDGGNNADIYAQRLDSGGLALWQAGGLPICTRSAHQYSPQLATDGTGGAIFTWEDQGLSPSGSGQQWVAAQHVNGAGTIQWADNGVTVYDRHSLGPTLVSDGMGGVLLTWDGFHQVSANEFRPAIYAQRVDEAGQNLWAASGLEIHYQPTGHYAFAPKAASDGAGGLIVYWQDYRFTGGYNPDIFASRINDQVPPPAPTSADVSVTLSASPEPVLIGASLTYTAWINNAGPDSATLVAFNIEVPPASTLAYVATTSGTCVGVDIDVSCNLGTLAVGSSATVTFAVEPYAPITLTSTAFVAGNQTDANGADNSSTVVSTVHYPVPVIDSISPASGGMGGPGFVLTIQGSRFTGASKVLWNGSPRSMTFSSSTKVQASITAADIALPATATVTVTNPTPGGGVSNSRTFVIGTPGLSISDASAMENAAAPVHAGFAVTLSHAVTNTVTVDFTTAAGTATPGADYAHTAGTLTFAPGQTSKTIAVLVLPDLLVEATETFTVDLSNPMGATVLDGRGQATILDGPPPTLSASPGCVVWTAPRIVSVTVSSGPGHTGDWIGLYPSGSSSYVDWWYLNGTRTQPGTGLVNATFNVTMPAAAGSYIFKLIGGATGSVLFTSNLVTVATSCGPSLSVNDVSVTEGDAASVEATFVVSLSPAATGLVTVQYATANGTATAGSDYTSTSGTLTFNAGETSRTISVPVLGDTATEDNESFTLSLSNPTGATIGDGSGTGTIVDNEVSPTGLTASPTCVFSTGTRVVSVTVAGGPGHRGDWVGFYPSGGGSYTDWWYLNGAKTQPGTGLANSTFDVTVPAALGTFTFKLIGGATGSVAFTSNPVSVATSCGPPTPALSINDVFVTEGDSGSINATFTVTLNPAAAAAVTLDYTTVPGTATAGSDYTMTSGTLTFAASETSKMITVPVLGDTAVEGNETYTVTLSNATGGATIADSSGAGTIIDNDTPPPGLSVSPSCVVSSSSRVVAVAVAGGPGHTGDWVGLYPSGSSTYVDWSYLNGTKSQPGTGLTSATFNVTMPATLGDYNFKLIGGATGSFVFTSNMVSVASSCGPPTPALSISDVSVTEGDAGSINANFTVALSPAATGTVTVEYTTVNGTATAGSDYTTTSGTLTFAASETSRVIAVSVLGDTAVEGNETYTVTLSNATGGATIADGSGAGTIVDNETPPTGLSASPNCVLSTGSRIVAVSVAGGPGHSGDWVGVYSSGSATYVDWWYLNGTKTYPSTGFTSASFNVTMPATLGDYNFKLIGGATGSVVFTSNLVSVATSCGPPAPALSINDASVTEGDSGSINADFTVTLSPAAPGAVTVAYQTANGTATAGSDYTTTTGTLTFAAGETSTMIGVPVLGDTAVEGNETYTVTLSNATGGAMIADGSGTGTIVDNETPPTGLSASPNCVLSTDSRIVGVSVAGGPGHSGDWVGLYPSGSSTYVDWWYLNGTKTQPGTGLVNASFNVTMPATLGDYTFKLIGGATGSVAFTSNLVSVATNCGTPLPALSINDVSVTEGDAGSVNANFTVTLNPAASFVVSVGFATSNGTATAHIDYWPSGGILTFAAGETSKTISVSVFGDTTVEGNETYSVTLSTATGGTTIADGSGAGTIVDNETPPSGLSASPSCILSSGSRIVGVSVAGGPGHSGDWVGLYPSGSSSYADWWYLSGTRTQPSAGLVNASFNVTMPAALGDYTFKLTGGGTGSIVFTSNPASVATSCGPPAPALSINDVSVTEQDAFVSQVAFTVALSPAANSPVTVEYTTSDGTATAGTDYDGGAGTITFEPGETSQVVWITVLGDTAKEGNEVFNVTLTGASGGAAITDATGHGTIIDTDGPPSGLSASPGCVVSSGARLAKLSVADGPGHSGDWVGLFVTGASHSGYIDWWYLNGAKPQPGSGLTSAEFGVTIPASPNELEFRLFGGAQGTLVFTSNTVRVAPSCTPFMSIDDTFVIEGNTGSVDANFTVTLSSATASRVTLSFTTVGGTALQDAEYALTSGTLTFEPGETSKTFSVSVYGDELLEPNESFFVLLSDPVNAVLPSGFLLGEAEIVNDDASPLTLVPVAKRLQSPVALAHAGDGSGRLFIVQQEGRILIHDGTRLITRPFLDIRSLVWRDNLEQGLLGVAFHPNFKSNGYFYVMYTDSARASRIARYRASAGDPNVADPSSALVLLTVDQPFPDHNAGQLAFGPYGYLYIALSDGGSDDAPLNAAQSLDTLPGKLLRIDVDSALPYAIPPTNPFVNTPGARPEIWAYGLRSPWRFSFDRATGDLFIGDVSPWWGHQEIDYQPAIGSAGMNYGWPVMDGSVCYQPSSGCSTSGLVLPIVEYSSCAVVGGYRYRGSESPDANGLYVFGDRCYGSITGATPGPGDKWSTGELVRSPYRISSWGEDEQGELYLAHLYDDVDGTGAVYRVAWLNGHSLSIDDVTVTEGNAGTTTATFTVSLLPPSAQTVTVDFSTQDYSAKAPGDYLATSGTLTFAPGATTRAISVAMNGDTALEGDESFGLNLTNAANAVITDGTGIGTIYDDDTPGVMSSLALSNPVQVAAPALRRPPPRREVAIVIAH